MPLCTQSTPLHGKVQRTGAYTEAAFKCPLMHSTPKHGCAPALARQRERAQLPLPAPRAATAACSSSAAAWPRVTCTLMHGTLNPEP